MGTAEAGLAAAWQLALRLDGKPEILTKASGPWHIEVTIPLAVTSPVPGNRPGSSDPQLEMQRTEASSGPDAKLDAAQASTETATQVTIGVPAS